MDCNETIFSSVIKGIDDKLVTIDINMSNMMNEISDTKIELAEVKGISQSTLEQAKKTNGIVGKHDSKIHGIEKELEKEVTRRQTQKEFESTYKQGSRWNSGYVIQIITLIVVLFGVLAAWFPKGP